MADITPEEWGALRSCADDDAPPTEATFPIDVYRGLAERGLMRVRFGEAPGGGKAEFFLTTPEGAVAAGMRLCALDVRHQGPCARVLGHSGRCMPRSLPTPSEAEASS